MMPLHPARADARRLPRGDCREGAARRAARLRRGLAGRAFLGHQRADPVALMFMASLDAADETHHVRTGVINLPNRHPAVIAAEVAQFDHMSEGRFIFGIGTGSLPSDYELFDIADAGQRQRMMLEFIDVHRAHLGAGPALRAQRRVLALRDQKGDQRAAWHRHHAEAATRWRAADLRRGFESRTRRPPELRAARGWGRCRAA